MVGMDLGVFLGGVLVIEKVFGWPGLGEQAWRAISNNDVPLVMGTVLVTAFFVAIFNLLADLLNAAVDPTHRPTPSERPGCRLTHRVHKDGTRPSCRCPTG